jgi:dTDP-D-glucose 4,6-dehydratase
MESDKSYGVGPVPYQEDQALRPHGIYEASKACVSHLVAAYFHNYHLPVFTIRSANVYGPGDQNKSRVVPNTIQRLLRGQPPEINEGADDFEREFIHVDDWVKIAVDLMRIGPWGEAVNVGSGECKTVAQVVYTICELMEVLYSPVIQNRPDTFCEIPRQSLCLEKLKSLLPEMTCRNLNQGLTETIQWYQNSI